MLYSRFSIVICINVPINPILPPFHLSILSIYVCISICFANKTMLYHVSSFHIFYELTHRSLLTGEGNGTPLQYSCLENPMDRGAWWAAIHGVEKSRTRLSDFTLTFHFHALEKEMATYSNVLAWRTPGTVEPGGLLSMGSHRVGHD